VESSGNTDYKVIFIYLKSTLTSIESVEEGSLIVAVVGSMVD